MALGLAENGVISNVSLFLTTNDMCSLDATSEEISTVMASGDGRVNAWLVFASRLEIGFSEVPAGSLKMLVLSFSELDRVFQCQTMPISTDKSAKVLANSAQLLVRSKKKHLQAGSRIATTFAATFIFSQEDISSYLSKTATEMKSRPVHIKYGNESLMFILTWRKRGISLSIGVPLTDADKRWDNDAAYRHSFQLIGVQLHAASSHLTLQKDFVFHKPSEDLEGVGLCYMPPAQDAFCKNMLEGILCVGLLHDFRANDTSFKGVSALGLDIPGWNHDCEVP